MKYAMSLVAGLALLLMAGGAGAAPVLVFSDDVEGDPLGGDPVADTLAVAFNGEILPCLNPMQPGAYNPASTAWQNYDVPSTLVRPADNTVTLRMAKQNARLADEITVEVQDMELAIEHRFHERCAYGAQRLQTD